MALNFETSPKFFLKLPITAYYFSHAPAHKVSESLSICKTPIQASLKLPQFRNLIIPYLIAIRIADCLPNSFINLVQTHTTTAEAIEFRSSLLLIRASKLIKTADEDYRILCDELFAAFENENNRCKDTFWPYLSDVLNKFRRKILSLEREK